MQIRPLFLGLVALVLLTGTVSANVEQRSRGRLSGESRTETFTGITKGSLEVSSQAGDIHVYVKDGNDVVVTVEGLERKDTDDLEISRNGNRIVVDFRSRDRRWMSRVRFNIDVPRNIDLDLRTGGGEIEIVGNVEGVIKGDTSGGDITIDDVTGEVDLNTSGGDIRAGTIVGRGYIRTSGGDIRVEKGTEALDIHTSGGDIIIRNAGNRVDARTSGGDIEIGDIGGEARITTSGGDIEVGRVSQGARISTSGGDIQLRSASGDVRASTAGGDLELEDVTGSVDARTAGGDIFVELTPTGDGRSTLLTEGGSISLSIDPDARVTIEARIRSGRRGWSSKSRRRDDRRMEYEIRSDFQSSEYEEDPDSGEIVAVYNLNGGGNRITLDTRDGNIDIRRLMKR